LLRYTLGDAAPALVVTDTAAVRAVAEDAGVATTSPADLLDSVPRDVPLPNVLPSDPVCFIYTSGSTAMPKAVVSTHAQMCFAVRAIQARLGYRPDDVVFCTLPTTFDYGLYQVFLCAVAGAALHLTAAAAAGQGLVRHLRNSGATVLPAVPSLAANLLRLLRRRPEDLPRLRLLTNTGAAMPPDVVGALRSLVPSLRVQLMYGLTECKRATIMPPDGDLERPGSCGLALPGTEVYVVGARGERLPAGEVGEITVRGPNVMAGYWNQPELTAARFPREDGLFPVLRTADRGWQDADGYLYFAGRDDDVYKQNGFRVSKLEVEAAATEVPGVDLAAVVPPCGGEKGSTVVIVGAVTAQQVLDGLASRLERSKLPGHCVVVDKLPLTRHGKVARDRLSALAATGGNHD